MVGSSQSKNKKTRARNSKKKAVISALDPLETGMPALDSILSVDEFKKGKKVLRIIHTNEVDEYERTPSKAKRKKR
jgi:hypothetical protein